MGDTFLTSFYQFFCSQMCSSVLKEVACQALDELDDKMIGLESQKKQLFEVFRRWRSSGKGDSCVVTGERSSGRTSLTMEIISSIHGVEKNHIYIAQLGSDVTAQEAFKGDQEKPRVIVIEDADELASRQRQTLLYSILNATRSYPWLVILMVNRQDFITCLEKRVRSRLSTAKITFQPALRLETYLEALHKFLTPEEKNADWMAFVDEFTKNASVRNELQYMFALSNSYSLLKTCVAVFLSWLADFDGTVDSAAAIWEDSVRTLLPSRNPFPEILNSLSLRTFCVFLCVYRRLKDQPMNSYIAYSKILVDYKHLVNTADKRMAISEDVLVFKEIDRLVQLGVFIGAQSTNNLSFKRVALHADPYLLKDVVSERVIPVNIREWFKTIPTN